jgi:MFS family permease
VSSKLRLHRWHDRPLVGVAILMAAAGFALFSPSAALGDVAEQFGDLGEGDTIAEQAGLPGSVLGGGLAVIRLAGLLALPLAALADRAGRRPTILAFATVGLAATIAAAASPSYWWFVAAFAVARPLLTATETVGTVLAAEHTGLHDRAKAIAMASAAYGIGAGAIAVLRGLAGEDLGFRSVFALAAIPLVAVPVAGRLLTEPDRFTHRSRAPAGGRTEVVPVLGAVPPSHRPRLAVLAAIAFATGLITGPVATLLFVYAENVLDVSSAVTAALVVAAGATGSVDGRPPAWPWCSWRGRVSSPTPDRCPRWWSGTSAACCSAPPTARRLLRSRPSSSRPQSDPRSPAGSWWLASWGRRQGCGWPARSRMRSTASARRWPRSASPQDWSPCCSHASRKPEDSSWSAPRPKSHIGASSRPDPAPRNCSWGASCRHG